MAAKSAAATVPADVAAAAAVAAARPKRVRTGCLTCRERHLKCDEAVPDCQNCKKSNRDCKRGVRLNFIDTTIKDPPITPPTEEWDVVFQDESREIASEYRGGLSRYTTLTSEGDGAATKQEPQFDFSSAGSIIQAPVLAHQQLPSHSAFPPGGSDGYPPVMQMQDQAQDTRQRHGSINSDSTFSSHTIGANPVSSYNNSKQTLTPPTETRETLTDPEELLFMQVFVEEVGIWMDSMDPYKHVGGSHFYMRIQTDLVVFTTSALRFTGRAHVAECFSCLRCPASYSCQSRLSRGQGPTLLRLRNTHSA